MERLRVLLVEDVCIDTKDITNISVKQVLNIEDASDELQNLDNYDILIVDTVVFSAPSSYELVNVYDSFLPKLYKKLHNIYAKNEKPVCIMWTTDKTQLQLSKTHETTKCIITPQKGKNSLLEVISIGREQLQGQKSITENVKIFHGGGSWKSVEQPHLSKPFSLLKHRVAHLFLSIDVDLQGIEVLTGQRKREMKETQNTPEDYLRDVLEGKNGDYYRQKLADLQFIVAKVNVGEEKPSINCNGKTSGDLAKASISEENLPGGKSILGLIPEEKRDDENIMSLLQRLLILSGLTFEDDRNLFKNITSGHKSPIFKFMCLMDCKVDKKNDINEQDVNDVMKIEGGKGWTVDGANVSPISSFHYWFCALVDCLEKLRKVIKSD
jgi:hypothetical protein